MLAGTHCKACLPTQVQNAGCKDRPAYDKMEFSHTRGGFTQCLGNCKALLGDRATGHVTRTPPHPPCSNDNRKQSKGSGGREEVTKDFQSTFINSAKPQAQTHISQKILNKNQSTHKKAFNINGMQTTVARFHSIRENRHVG